MGAGLGWLTPGGAVAATVVGGAVLRGGGWPGGALLAVFFLSGSILSFGTSITARRRGTGRTWRQVGANGGWAAVGALLIPSRPEIGLAILVGALSAAQADTWGTELGRHSRRPPRLLVGGQPVLPGTSGGVTWLGTGAGAGGAALMAGLAFLLGAPPAIAAWGAVGGICGTVADSFVGSTVQARYTCRTCGKELERAAHGCPTPAPLTSGIRWIDNDVVNTMATAVGGAMAVMGVVLVP